MRGGQVHHAGPGGSGGFSSRHVVIKVNDPTAGVMYHVYVHLDSIHPAVSRGASIAQGQVIGTVGKDDATYFHLHMELRKGTPRQIGSVHPLGYLPYTDTANWSPPVADRFNRLDAFMAARLLFGARSKLEGDLKRVEVDLRRGTRLLTTRVVDFDDKSTIFEGRGDSHVYVNDIGVEGYQKSDMIKHQRTDLAYGTLVRRIPRTCDALVARVIDAGGNVATSGIIDVPEQAAVDEFVDFEDGQLPPAGWVTVASAGGSGTEVSIAASAAHSGAHGMRCVDQSTTEASTQRAGIEYALPAGRFEWRAEGWFKSDRAGVVTNSTGSGAISPVFPPRGQRSQCGRAHPQRRRHAPGRARREEPGRWAPVPKWARGHRGRGMAQVATGVAPGGHAGDDRHPLSRRGGTHEGAGAAELGFDRDEPLSLRAGIGFSSMGAAATVMTDELWLTESTLAE